MTGVIDFETVDFFTDQSLIPDPYPYFDYLRAKSPITREPHQGVLAVTGYAEASEIYKSPDFSACVSVAGPFSGLPFEPVGCDGSGVSDVSDLIAQHRSAIPMSEHIVTQDPPEHTRTRELLNRLLTPKRLKENEEFMWRLADQQLDTFIGAGACDFMEQYAKPFATLVIADLLGVPEADHREFRQMLAGEQVGALDDKLSHNPLQWLEDKFFGYIDDRRKEPRADVLTQLAEARYPDGSVPEVTEVMKVATFLFAAGQETTTKLLGFSLRVIAERPDLQALLREDRSRIPAFLEESLRTESPVKAHFRMAKTTVTIGGVTIPAGTTVMLLPGACNRDPRKFEDPGEFRIDRPNVREHLTFARGVHSCPGSPLVRAEGRISLNRVLDRMADITIDEEKHGRPGDRRYSYEPSFIMRGLEELHLRFDPVG